MEFHPDKCEVISVTRKKNPISYPCHAHGHHLKHMNYVKYLGVHITSDLRWDKHIDNICSRANSSLGFIWISVNIGNPRVKGLAYQSYVRPVLDYSPTVWDTVGSIKKIESVQRRAARFTLGRYRRTSSVNAMLTHLNWEPLASRRHAARLLE